METKSDSPEVTVTVAFTFNPDEYDTSHMPENTTLFERVIAIMEAALHREADLPDHYFPDDAIEVHTEPTEPPSDVDMQYGTRQELATID